MSLFFFFLSSDFKIGRTLNTNPSIRVKKFFPVFLLTRTSSSIMSDSLFADASRRLERALNMCQHYD